jgi:hypothetical protein
MKTMKKMSLAALALSAVMLAASPAMAEYMPSSEAGTSKSGQQRVGPNAQVVKAATGAAESGTNTSANAAANAGTPCPYRKNEAGSWVDSSNNTITADQAKRANCM